MAKHNKPQRFEIGKYYQQRQQNHITTVRIEKENNAVLEKNRHCYGSILYENEFIKRVLVENNQMIYMDPKDYREISHLEYLEVKLRILKNWRNNYDKTKRILVYQGRSRNRPAP